MEDNKAKGVYRLEAEGPAASGLEKMELDPVDFQSPLPEQHLHTYFEDEKLGLSVGVWTTTSMQEAFGPYPGDEFMCVLEGRVAMVDGQGKETPVEAGQSFCIRNGFPTSWKQVGFLRKFYVTYADPSAPAPRIESAEGGVVVLDPSELEAGLEVMDTTEPFVIHGEAPTQRDSGFFTNAAGNLFVGMWDSEAFESEMRPFPCYEFVKLLEGEVTITEEDGKAQTFRAGDAFFVPQDTVCSWKTGGYVKKLYAILDPAAA
jgi:uncharacterized cupin superfamily protein